MKMVCRPLDTQKNGTEKRHSLTSVNYAADYLKNYRKKERGNNMSIYRQYEDPYKLEKQLAELKEQRANTINDSELEWLNEAIAELEERVNFAWQDQEFEMME